MKKFLQVSFLLSSVLFSVQSNASYVTFIPTMSTGCAVTGHNCLYKELSNPAIEKEALEVLATEDDGNLSDELESLIAAMKSAEPKYSKLKPIDVLRREYIKNQIEQSNK